MSDTINLNRQQLIAFREAAAALVKFRKAFGRDPEPSYLAEISTSTKLKLRLVQSPNQKGFDALDKNKKKYQIKYRNAQNVDINNFKFDYILLVNSTKKNPFGAIWCLTKSDAKNIFMQRKKFRKYQVTQKKFKNHAKRL